MFSFVYIPRRWRLSRSSSARRIFPSGWSQGRIEWNVALFFTRYEDVIFYRRLTLYRFQRENAVVPGRQARVLSTEGDRCRRALPSEYRIVSLISHRNQLGKVLHEHSDDARGDFLDRVTPCNEPLWGLSHRSWKTGLSWPSNVQ